MQERQNTYNAGVSLPIEKIVFKVLQHYLRISADYILFTSFIDAI